MSKYNDYQEHYYKTGNALYDLYCRSCTERIYKKGEKIQTSCGDGDERCCSNCDYTLHRRSHGGQSDTWGFTKKDVGQIMLRKAIVFANKKHKGQLDDDKNNYFEAHLFPVYLSIQELTNDVDILSAAILHDTLEDTHATYEELEKTFGKRVADLVNEVTHEGKKDNRGYYFPRLKSADAIMIKLIDRASNISRMDAWSEERKQHYLKKTKFWSCGK